MTGQFKAMFKAAILIIVAFNLFACNGIEKKVWHYPNGQVEVEAQYKGGVQHGKMVEYYPNGKIKSVSFFNHGLREGELQGYYENGNKKLVISYHKGVKVDTANHYYEDGSLKQIIPYKNGLTNGWVLFYDQSGKLTEKHEYFSYGREEHQNQFIEYDEKGRVNKDSSMFITLSSQRDTISLGEQYKFSIKLETPMYGEDGQMEVQIGGFNEEYRLIENAIPDTVKAIDNIATVTVVPKHRGMRSVRGRVVNYRINNNLKADSTWIKKEIHIYFTKEYQVQ